MSNGEGIAGVSDGEVENKSSLSCCQSDDALPGFPDHSTNDAMIAPGATTLLSDILALSLIIANDPYFIRR